MNRTRAVEISTQAVLPVSTPTPSLGHVRQAKDLSPFVTRLFRRWDGAGTDTFDAGRHEIDMRAAVSDATLNEREGFSARRAPGAPPAGSRVRGRCGAGDRPPAPAGRHAPSRPSSPPRPSCRRSSRRPPGVHQPRRAGPHGRRAASTTATWDGGIGTHRRPEPEQAVLVEPRCGIERDPRPQRRLTGHAPRSRRPVPAPSPRARPSSRAADAPPRPRAAGAARPGPASRRRVLLRRPVEQRHVGHVADLRPRPRTVPVLDHQRDAPARVAPTTGTATAASSSWRGAGTVRRRRKPSAPAAALATRMPILADDTSAASSNERPVT